MLPVMVGSFSRNVHWFQRQQRDLLFRPKEAGQQTQQMARLIIIRSEENHTGRHYDMRRYIS